MAGEPPALKEITLPLDENAVAGLRSGDELLLTGEIYVARDAAHQRLCQALREGGGLPFPLAGQVIYFMGPTPAPPGRVIGAAGPTSSYRLDPYSPVLLAAGLKGMIGKGMRSRTVKEAMLAHRAVYMAAVGGAGALLGRCIEKVTVVAYEDLGPEALLCIEVRDFPVTVINDVYGGDLYQEGRARWQRNPPAREGWGW